MVCQALIGKVVLHSQKQSAHWTVDVSSSSKRNFWLIIILYLNNDRRLTEMMTLKNKIKPKIKEPNLLSYGSLPCSFWSLVHIYKHLSLRSPYSANKLTRELSRIFVKDGGNWQIVATIVHELSRKMWKKKTVKINIAKDGEWCWNSVKCKIWFTR